jgi:hypothetical protein
MRRASGENAIDSTVPFLEAENVRLSPVATVQRRAFASKPPVARSSPSGVAAIAFSMPAWPSSTRGASPDGGHKRTFASAPTLANQFPFGEKSVL